VVGGVVVGTVDVVGVGGAVGRGSGELAGGGGATRWDVVGGGWTVVAESRSVVVGRTTVVAGTRSVVVGRATVIAGAGSFEPGAAAAGAPAAVDASSGPVVVDDVDAGGFDVVSNVSPSRVTR
jgi:hypothetical protein